MNGYVGKSWKKKSVREGWIIAKKDHKCKRCEIDILKGDSYFRLVGEYPNGSTCIIYCCDEECKSRIEWS